MNRACSLVLIVLCAVLADNAQSRVHWQTPDKQQNSQVKMNPAKQTSAESGQEMYMNYCASCHGRNAKGDGPAATALNRHPADLTALSHSHGGVYPGPYVTNVLEGKAKVTSHGTQEMPVWGPIFRGVSSGHEGEVQLRIHNLNSFLQSLQK
jgi:mono/diheme cytochrome c family protein